MGTLLTISLLIDPQTRENPVTLFRGRLLLYLICMEADRKKLQSRCSKKTVIQSRISLWYKMDLSNNASSRFFLLFFFSFYFLATFLTFLLYILFSNLIRYSGLLYLST